VTFLGAPSADADDDEQPLAIGPVLRVDTTGPVDILELAAWCRSEFMGRSRMSERSGGEAH
jgi:hypothetical protein